MHPTPVKITNSNGQTTQGQVQIQHFTNQERLHRALKFLGIFWGASILAIALPLIHFVLVPGLFLAGIIGAYVKYNTKSLVMGGKGTCPRCQEKLVIVKGPNRWPLQELCTCCRTESKIHQTTPSS